MKRWAYLARDRNMQIPYARYPIAAKYMLRKAYTIMTNGKNAHPPGANIHHRSPQVVHFINKFLDAACDASRRSILELLIPPDGQVSPETYELRAGEIASKLELAPSTTSEHLHQLLKLHLVNTRKEGNMVYYRLRNHHLILAFHELLKALETHYTSHDLPSERLEMEED
jgi:DNA-binding transcriptional ArsR family regulator